MNLHARFEIRLEIARSKHHDAHMRTTLTLNEEIAKRAKRSAARLGLSFKDVINRALEEGLSQLERENQARPFRTEPVAMGLTQGLSYDNVAELIARGESEDFK
jgi:hypothetical protein